MGKIKSLIISTTVDKAIRAHDCQANSRHRIKGGDFRLKVKNGRSWDYYCKTCAEKILEESLRTLVNLQTLSRDEG